MTEQAPRWDEDAVVLKNGWDTPDRCGKCGEVNRKLLAERDRLAAIVTSIKALEIHWSRSLDDGCPSCGPHVEFCDHVEGYHHALSDLTETLASHEEKADE